MVENIKDIHRADHTIAGEVCAWHGACSSHAGNGKNEKGGKQSCD
jgi:hypothetical protein